MKNKISGKSAKRIGNLFASIQAAEIMQRDAIEKKQNDIFQLFRKEQVESTIALFNEFGIELPCYKLFAGQMAKEC